MITSMHGFPGLKVRNTPQSCRHPGLSLTAVGARRALALGVPGIEEDVGLIGVHLPNGGPFVELVPWTGSVEWDVDPWGKWWARTRMKRKRDATDSMFVCACPSYYFRLNFLPVVSYINPDIKTRICPSTIPHPPPPFHDLPQAHPGQ